MILGIDEVGRGPWAGPLVIGAVILEDASNEKWDELNDSKKLTQKKREKLSPQILEYALAAGLGWVSSYELDEVGLACALPLATKRAVEQVEQVLEAKSLNINDIEEIIIDGTINFLANTPYEDKVTLLKKADSLVKEVSAASIIAKVARDNYMIDLAKKYPEYQFEKHVGYGTAAHRKAIEVYGICPEHRKSFRPIREKLDMDLKSINPAGNKANNQEKATEAGAKNAAKKDKTRTDVVKNTTKVGRKAEDSVADYLKLQGHSILSRNYRAKRYEIDIVSATKEHIYFTEVKYRNNKFHGDPLDSINKKKLEKMKLGAEAFTVKLAEKLGRSLENIPSPILAVASVTGKNFKIEEWTTLDS